MDDKPDRTALTPEEKEIIGKHLREKVANLTCSICGHEELILADHLVSPSIVNPSGGMIIGGQNYPMAMLICARCLHVNFYAAVPMGVMRRRKKDDQSDQSDG